jgi:hypothetical protein
MRVIHTKEKTGVIGITIAGSKAAPYIHFLTERFERTIPLKCGLREL